MSLVFCPECKEQVSQYAEACPKCGFPIKNFIEENHMDDFTKVFICPKCADSYDIEGIPAFLKCEYCHTTLVLTDIDMSDLHYVLAGKTNEESKKILVDLAKKFGNDQFDEDAYNDRIEKIRQRSLKKLNMDIDVQKTKISSPHCPTCSSTDIKKISTTSKAINAGLFGLLGNKRKKQFHCNNCGYEW